MAEFKLERFKYTWKGAWETSTSYKRDDVVRVGGKSYVCLITHASSATFETDLNAILPGSNPPLPQPKWVLMTDGRIFLGDWNSGSDYNLGDIVKFGGSLWLCTLAHTSTTIFANDFSNWSTFVQTTSYQGDWTNQSYAPGDVVSYNGNVYKCINAHQAIGFLEGNANDWELYLDGIEYAGDWVQGNQYYVNQLVRYGGSIYRCTQTHRAIDPAINILAFNIEIAGSQFNGIWATGVYYQAGDIVKHGGFMYYAVNNNYDSKPYADNGSLDWILLARASRFTGTWDINSDYKTGDIALRGGYLYQAVRDIGPGESVDGSTVDYLEEDTWELLVPGKSFKGTWTEETVYSIGDVVYFGGSAWTCNFEHESALINSPGDNGNIFEYWDLLIQAGIPAGLRKAGDLLTYGLSREDLGDGSTLGDTRLPIGEENQILSVSNELDVFWRNITEDSDTIFVAPNGIDSANRGSFQNPFKTIRYAAEYVEDNFDPLTPVIIRASAGKYDEIGPIIIPAGCAINGDELRSTTIVATGPKEEYQNDYYTYHIASLAHLNSILLDIITATPITPQPGNILDQNTNIVPSGLEGADRITNLITDYQNFVEFRIISGSIEPTLSGSNIESTDSLVVLAGENLFTNEDFVIEDCIKYLEITYPTITFDRVQITNDLHSVIRGVKRDTKYSGNYGALTAARRFANAVTGSKADNLFLVRDTTGLRDCTIRGLEGVLNPPGVFDLYQKPTGGACVSLDPGWGPDDDRTWIINRSPYIQGVTNIGSGCVGKKIDGSLHNGGNRSMTSNDFTQVLSDGIGVWVLNNARAELVSVFTYYCQIGYFAEDGGIIRAANGNNSYGSYGSIADGFDATETPQVTTANNRTNEAQVGEAFAGGNTDSILLFEYLNGGENYTQANATIVGSGSNAEVEFTDFRNGGLFEVRLTSPDGSSTEGGSGYLIRQGSAQETIGASSTIKLSTSDVTQFLSEIEGMRLIITDGTGVGQYGYVDDFDFATRVVTVRRESDNELGWDHINPGTPLATDLDLTTRYQFEPRIYASGPSYDTAEYNLITNRTYVDAEYGNTTETYTNVSGGANFIWKDDEQNFITVSSIVSDTALQFNAIFTTDPTVPFNIRGRITGATAEVVAISANTGEIIEVDIDANGQNFQVGEEIDILLASGSGETFDTAGIPATFDVLREGPVYTPTLVTGGSGYNPGDIITILGTALGGTTPANDLQITVLTTSEDSTNSVVTFSSTGTGETGVFVLLTNSEKARYSTNGIIWTEVDLPYVSTNTKLIAGNNRFLALTSGESRLASSLTGAIWTEVALPLEAAWSSGVYGGGKFVLVNSDTDIVISSTDGETWTTASIPDDTDGGLDSTESQYGHIVYGNGTYLAISVNDLAVATSSDGVNWTRHDSATPDFSTEQIVGAAFGNGRFVIVTDSGSTAYSFDGITWIQGNGLGLTDFICNDMKFNQGLFVAIGQDVGGPINQFVTSEFGLTWTSRTLESAKNWTALTNGPLGDTTKWLIVSSIATTGAINHVSVGANAFIRAEVVTGSFRSVKIWNPGSSYTSAPNITVVDPNNIGDATFESRIGDGVLSQPEFVNKGSGYRRNTSVITIAGDGFADIVPTENTLVVDGVRNIPSPGVQITITGILNDLTPTVPDDLFIFSGVTVEDLGDDGTGNETRTVRFTITPSIGVENNVTNGTVISLRERFSQCRLSGHDFLDIGTGNFEQTNYPEIYAGGRFFTALPENEVYEANSGRVFYVSTDQDGNFRTGELFAVQQATGVVTISAQFFDLDGLSELALGGVRLGGSGTVINEFSTDGTFAADSNNVIPTQRAIVTFLADRLSVGGENLETNRLVAGRVALGGEENVIETTTRQYLLIPVDVDFSGTYQEDDGEGNLTTRQTNISGTIISQMLYFKGFDESMQ